MDRPRTSPLPGVLASVDLGSNSFHLVVARYSHGRLVIVDRLREAIRLGSGVDEKGCLDESAMARAIACLGRFGRRLRDIHPDLVRVVGTHALRVARHKDAFLERAREALGHPIEIVSGIEEARLIYLGVARTMPDEPGRRLVIDIGGGSTELIIGEGCSPLELESLRMGCVSLSERFFADGRISAPRLHHARRAARLALEPVQAAFRRGRWDYVIGSSGLVRTIVRAITDLGGLATTITAAGLQRLVAYAIGVGHMGRLALQSLTEDRRLILPGGLAIILELFELLGIEEMRVSEGTMREGLLYDMLDRLMRGDARECAANE